MERRRIGISDGELDLRIRSGALNSREGVEEPMGGERKMREKYKTF